MKSFVSIALFLVAPIISSAQFNAGETVRILDIQEDDLYVAGGEVTIDAPVYGDVMAAGGELVFNDSIGEDLTVAGGEITINGPTGDDLRITGGQVTVRGVVYDDVIVFGGDVLIASSAVIKGNLVSYTGKTAIEGTVEGAVKATGGEITISGSISGPSQLVAEDISIGDGAAFMSDVSYYSKDGEVDFGTSLIGVTATLDESLGWKDRMDHEEERSIGAGIGLIGWIMFLVSGFIILALINKFFSGRFKRASEQAMGATVNSLGYGLIYLILVPLALIVLMITIVGIPAALLLLTLYIITITLGSLIFGLLLSHLLNKRKGGTWGFWKMVLIGLGLAFALKLVALIPFIGGLASFVAIAIAFGAILLTMRNEQGSAVPV
jgi:cytoskeletal protein CcmA (bactofilin family)